MQCCDVKPVILFAHRHDAGYSPATRPTPCIFTSEKMLYDVIFIQNDYVSGSQSHKANGTDECRPHPPHRSEVFVDAISIVWT